jgi:hypothetical protein
MSHATQRWRLCESPPCFQNSPIQLFWPKPLTPSPAVAQDAPLHGEPGLAEARWKLGQLLARMERAKGVRSDLVRTRTKLAIVFPEGELRCAVADACPSRAALPRCSPADDGDRSRSCLSGERCRRGLPMVTHAFFGPPPCPGTPSRPALPMTPHPLPSRRDDGVDGFSSQASTRRPTTRQRPEILVAGAQSDDPTY